MNTPEWLHQPPLPWHGTDRPRCPDCGVDIMEAATHTAPGREPLHPSHRVGPGLWRCHGCYRDGRHARHQELASEGRTARRGGNW